MKYTLSLLLLGLFFFASCDDDDDQVTPIIPNTSDTDANVDAPIVACGGAFDVFSYSTLPSPTDKRIVGLSYNGEGTGIAVGRDRVLYRVTQNGTNWQPLSHDLGDNFLHSPFFASSETLYLVRSYNGERDSDLLRSDDGGQSFREIPITNGRTVTDVYFNNTNEGWVIVNTSPISGPQNYALLRTTDGGQNWAEQTLPVELSYDNFVTVQGRLAINSSLNLLIYEEATNSWEVRPYPGPTVCCTEQASFDGLGNGIVVSGNEVYTTTDGGLTWSTDGVNYGRPEKLYLGQDGRAFLIVHRYTAQSDVLFFRGLVVYESRDSGVTWSVKKTDGDCSFGRYIFPTETDRIVSIGQREMVLLD